MHQWRFGHHIQHHGHLGAACGSNVGQLWVKFGSTLQHTGHQQFCSHICRGTRQILHLAILSAIQLTSMSSQMNSKSASSVDGEKVTTIVAVGQPGPPPGECNPIPVEPAPSSMVNEGPSIYADCVFGCGPPRPTYLMVNTGTATHPRWMCKPCNGARKAIEHQAKNDTALKASLSNLKKRDPDLWRAKVRSCRIQDVNAPPPGQLGFSTSISARAA